ncbi:MAG TPA: helix-turn-helix transcriptional regulator, partial [Mycobacteriales bacterium]|nr:helix-turn-helix transcriptional regulator [Mycobacteriales bacterium]
MPNIKYPEGRPAREHLRDALRRRGRDGVDDFAEGIRGRWGYGHLRSYRLALELSLEQVCEKINALQETYAGDPGHMDHSTLSKLERWPVSDRRPTVSQLVALARVFDTAPSRLVAPSDWDAVPAIDRAALGAFDEVRGATAPAGTVGMMGATRPQAGDPPRTPPNWWVSPDTFRSGNPIERAVTMANDESTRYADHGGNIGPAALEQLRDNLAQVSRRFAG